MFRRITHLILTLQWPVLILLAVMTAGSGAAIFHLRIDPSMESLFNKTSKEYALYREYSEKYGSDQLVAVAMDTEDVFKLRNLVLLKTLTEEIERLPGVERVLSLANAMDLRHKFMGVKLVPVFETLYEEEDALKEIKKSVLKNEIFVGNLISADGKVASLLIYLESGDKSRQTAGPLIRELRRFLSRIETSGLHFYMAGAPVEQYDFIDLIRRDQMVFIPMITGLLVIATLLIYRSVVCMLASMSMVFVTLVWTLGSIALAGDSLNLMTSLLAPVIMIITVANSIHLLNLFFEVRQHHPNVRECIMITLEQLGMPCLLTYASTILGFISLAITPVPAIQSFGIYSALGAFYSYVLSLTLTPILFQILPGPCAKKPSRPWTFLRKAVVTYLEELEFRWKYWILALTVLALAASWAGIQRLEIDTNLVKQMKPNLPLAIATRFIDERLTGVYSVGFILHRRDRRPMTDLESLKKLEAFQVFLERRPEVTKVHSITALIKKIHEAREDDPHAYRLPEDEDSLARYFEGISKSGDPELRKLISRDGKEVRIGVRMRAVGTREGSAFEQASEKYLQEHFGRDFEFYQTGNIVLLGRMARDLVHQQTASFKAAFLSILVVISLFFHSLKVGLLAAVPSLFPILMIYGLMGWMGIELSSTTAMISSIVLGLVVDEAAHFLHRYRLEFSRRGHYVQALHHTLRNVGQAAIISSLILVAGFASSVFANFRPTVHFGLLTSVTILIALLCTLIVLPICLIFLRPFGRQKLFKKTGLRIEAKEEAVRG